MNFVSLWTSLFVLVVARALANTEKAIFLAPDAIFFPATTPNLQNLQLNTITRNTSTLQQALTVAFPSKEQPRGVESWYLLRQLKPGSRYEVRVCWASTQPTEFWLDTFETSHVFDTPELIQSLAAFSEQRIRDQTFPLSDNLEANSAKAESLLFLRIQAAADFYTTNRTLMQRPPAVNADIILDPFLLNVFPTSLLPTASYLVFLAVAGFILSGWMWRNVFAFDISKQHQD